MSNRSAPLLRLAALALLLVAPQACATAAKSARPAPAVTGQEPEASQLRQWLTDLSARSRQLSGLQTPAIMEYRAGSEHLKAREQIAVRRPLDLRVEAYSPFGIATVVTANHGAIAVYQPSDNTLLKGPASVETLYRFTRIPLRPTAVVRLLLGLLPQDSLASRPPDSIRSDDDGSLVATYRDSNGQTDELGFANGKLVLVRSISPDPGYNYSVRYSDYRDIGGISFPHRLEADFPGTGSALKLIYQRPIINPELADSMFVLSPPGAKVELMSQAELNPVLERLLG